MHIPFCYEDVQDKGLEPLCISVGAFETPVSPHSTSPA